MGLSLRPCEKHLRYGKRAISSLCVALTTILSLATDGCVSAPLLPKSTNFAGSAALWWMSISTVI